MQLNEQGSATWQTQQEIGGARARLRRQSTLLRLQKGEKLNEIASFCEQQIVAYSQDPESMADKNALKSKLQRAGLWEVFGQRNRRSWSNKEFYISVLINCGLGLNRKQYLKGPMTMWVLHNNRSFVMAEFMLAEILPDTCIQLIFDFASLEEGANLKDSARLRFRRWDLHHHNRQNAYHDWTDDFINECVQMRNLMDQDDISRYALRQICGTYGYHIV